LVSIETGELDSQESYRETKSTETAEILKFDDYMRTATETVYADILMILFMLISMEYGVSSDRISLSF